MKGKTQPEAPARRAPAVAESLAEEIDAIDDELDAVEEIVEELVAAGELPHRAVSRSVSEAGNSGDPPPQLDNVATSAGFVLAGAPIVDTFVLTNATGSGEPFFVSQVTLTPMGPAGQLPAAVITPGSGQPAPSSAVSGVGFAIVVPQTPQTAKPFSDLTGLNAALTALAPAASVTIAVSYALAPGVTSIATELTALLAGGDVLTDGQRVRTWLAENAASAVDIVVTNPAFTVSTNPALPTPPLGPSVTPGATYTDSFALTNASGVPGTFTVQASVVAPNGSSPVVSYTCPPAQWSVTPPAGPPTSVVVAPGGGPISIGVSFTAPDATNGQSVLVLFAATFTAATPPGAQPPAGPTPVFPSSSQTLPLVHGIVQKPQVAISNAGAPKPLTLTPGNTAIDSFAIENTSGQAANIGIAAIDLTLSVKSPARMVDYHDRQFTNFNLTTGGDPARATVIATAKSIAELNALLADLPPTPNLSIVQLDASYTVPPGEPNAVLTDTLRAYAVAGPASNIAAPNAGSVNNTLGSIGDLLASVVSELQAGYANLDPAAISGVLRTADRQMENFVNDADSLPAQPRDLSRDLSRELALALAIHDLSDGLYDRLISQDQVALHTDAAP